MHFRFRCYRTPHHKTLIGFKRLMELAAGAGVVLSVLLIGNPKLGSRHGTGRIAP